ncbi:enoyl-CoA hydratase/isomerase family protein [Hoeflea prorocentri]|uniref:Enoyl-CoA hydratase/isomerase family protein n=1 Tax=Hoeflea prorocentri TaxID=1922333 RepID=A0A9X3UG49_9HYPH|nr:enoyl-CoA hydratase/isomerase family protein [Hoeflea prorocentri]MCY6380168.1 enoyl-CoA hydratase/isomerase family protein [Hoeflea prorocentri]MDA5397968.1 enoyl-CoA hydratase/isomerase family protein [Hoeflea prorocentri]
MTDRYAAYSKLKLDYPADRILRITFSNPESFNSVDGETHGQLTEIWREIDHDPQINAVIVTGEGKAFSSGGDFKLIEEMADDYAILMRVWKEAKDLVYNIVNCNTPIISAINGPAAGAGLVVGLLADISIAGKAARIVDGHPRLGVAAGDVAAIIWPLLCGMAKAKYYLLTGKPMTGEEAERIGLVSLCVEDAELQETALTIAKDLSSGSQSAIRWTKYSLNNWLRSAGPIFDTSTALEMLGFMGPDVREGLASLREKRKPEFDPDCPI